MTGDWYDERPEVEVVRRGRLVARPEATTPGGRDRVLFELATGTEPVLAVYAPESEDRLRAKVGHDVELTGKVVDLSAEGFGIELWVRPPEVGDG